MNIPVIIHKDDGSVYGVTVPDIPGCYSYGENIDQAVQNTKDAIYSHVGLLLELNEPVNISSSSVDELSKNPEYQGGIWMLLDIDMDKLDTKPARINVSFPRFVLSKIDSYLESEHRGRENETRSGFLARAALKAIEEDQQQNAA